MIGRGSKKIDDARERVDAVERGTGAFKNLDGVHGFKRDRKVEIVVRGLAVVDAEAVEQDQRLLKAAAAQDEIGLRAACAALLKENGGVLAQEIERGFGGQLFAFERQNLYGARRLGKRYGRCRAEHHHGFRADRNGGGGRLGVGCLKDRGGGNAGSDAHDFRERHRVISIFGAHGLGINEDLILC